MFRVLHLFSSFGLKKQSGGKLQVFTVYLQTFSTVFNVQVLFMLYDSLYKSVWVVFVSFVCISSHPLLLCSSALLHQDKFRNCG